MYENTGIQKYRFFEESAGGLLFLELLAQGNLIKLHTGEVYQAVELKLDQQLNTDFENSDRPKKFTVDNVFPNPFNPNANISFSISEESPITLQVYNILGENIETVFENKVFAAGNHLLNWNASNHPNGTYFFKIITNQGNLIKKAMLLK